jgi:hypothetical protein
MTPAHKEKQNANKMTAPHIIASAVAVFCLSSVVWITQLDGLFFLDKIFVINWISGLMILGITLLTGLLCEWVLPSGVSQWAENLVSWINERRWFSISLLAVGLFTALVSVNQWVLHSFMSSGDEHSCYFLAECLRQGRVFADPPALYDFFETTHIGNRDGKWFSVYPPGWPLLFAGGLSLGMADFVNPILAVLATIIFIKAGELLFGFRVSFLAMLFISFTPFSLFNNASYFSHTTCFLMIALFLYSYLKWVKGSNSIVWASICASAIAYGLGTRYMTMAAISAPFLIYELFQVFGRSKKWQRSHTIFSVILTTLVFFSFYFNFAVTGNFFEAPNHYHHSWERLGFHGNYTLLNGLQYVAARFVYLMEWFPPILLAVYFFTLLKPMTVSAVGRIYQFAFLCLPFSYIFYYSWGGNQYGPRYYFEGLPFLGITVVLAARHAWNRRDAMLRKFVIGLAAAAFIGNIYSFGKHARYFNQVSSERKALYELADRTIKEPSIVFIHGFLGDALVMSEEDAVRNHPLLNTRIIYAHDRLAENQILMNAYPGRKYYLGDYDRKNKQPRLQLIDFKIYKYPDHRKDVL